MFPDLSYDALRQAYYCTLPQTQVRVLERAYVLLLEARLTALSARLTVS